MTLRTDQLDVVPRAALFARQAVVSGELARREGPATQGAGDRIGHDGSPLRRAQAQHVQPLVRLQRDPAQRVRLVGP